MEYLLLYLDQSRNTLAAAILTAIKLWHEGLYSEAAKLTAETPR
jgi:hypothetical protein